VDLLYGLTYGAIAALVRYLYYAISLTIIARKTGTANAWWAWIPGLNLGLVSKAAGFPAWMGILLLVPIAGTFAGLAVAAALALKLGRSMWLTLLHLTPYTSWILPGYLAASPSLAGPTRCPQCSTPRNGAMFCCACGLRYIDPLTPAPPKALAVTLGALPKAIATPASFAAIWALVSVAWGGFLVYRLYWPAEPSDRLGAAVVRSYKEFPYEGPGQEAPRPESITTVALPDFQPADVFLKSFFPPDIDLSKIGRLGAAATAARYSLSGANADVQVIETESEEVPRKIVEAFSRSRGAKWVELQPDQLPNAGVQGIMVALPRIVRTRFYVLVKKGTGLVTIVTSEQPGLAGRLIKSLGKNGGLLGFPIVRAKIDTLPFRATDGGESAISLKRIDMKIPSHLEQYQRIHWLERLVTQDASIELRYERSGQRWNVLEAVYISEVRAHISWQAMRFLLSMMTDGDWDDPWVLAPLGYRGWKYLGLGPVLIPGPRGLIMFDGPPENGGRELLRQIVR
jgi:hypothetical protein